MRASDVMRHFGIRFLGCPSVSQKFMQNEFCTYARSSLHQLHCMSFAFNCFAGNNSPVRIVQVIQTEVAHLNI